MTATLIDDAMLADAGLFAGCAVLLVLLSLAAPASHRKGILPMAVLAVVGVLGIYMLQQFGGSFRSETPGLLLREALLAVIAFSVVSAATLFGFKVALARLAAPRILADVVVALALIAYALYRLNALGVNLVGIATTSAVVTGAIAFSAQETLGNLWGGLALQLERTCRIGDWVRVDDVTGQVVSIRWRYLALATHYNETVVIPNATLMKNRITVLGRRGEETAPWRHRVRFQLDFDHPPSMVVPRVEAALADAEIENVAHTPKLLCICTGFGDSGIDYAVVFCSIDPRREWWTESQVRLHLYAALTREGMGIPFPRRVVEIRGDQRQQRVERDHAQRLAALEASDIFRALTPEEHATLARALTACPYIKGDLIFRKGDAADSLFILSHGHVDVIDEVAATGARIKLVSLTAPAYFGEMGLLLGNPRRATVMAAGDVLCYRLDKPGFDAVLSARPELATELSRVLEHRQAQNDATLLAVGADAQARQARSRGEDLVRRIRAFFALK